MIKIELKFHTDFYETIKDNVKVSTTRLHEKEDIHIDSIVKAVFINNNSIAENELLIKIVNIEKVLFKDLELSHAVNGGYNHVNLLKHELEKIYPEIAPEDECYVYTFKVVKQLGRKPMNFTVGDIAKEVQRIECDISNNKHDSAIDRCVLLDALLCDIEDKKVSFSID